MIDLYVRSTWTDWQGLPVMIRRYEIGFCSLETAIREMKRLADGQDPDQLARQKTKKVLHLLVRDLSLTQHRVESVSV
jgi:hypothetical protein